jgi:hypothetical protein
VSETKWTPGPWRVFTTPDGRDMIGIGEATGEGVVDCGFGVWRSGDEKLANAHLIAAAPALYEALAKMVDVFGVQFTDGLLSHEEDALADARAALGAKP